MGRNGKSAGSHAPRRYEGSRRWGTGRGVEGRAVVSPESRPAPALGSWRLAGGVDGTPIHSGALPNACIHPLYGPHGEILTDDWTPDHPHHRGIYWAWPEVDWQGKRGDLHALQHVFARPTGKIETQHGADFAQITAENVWRWEQLLTQPNLQSIIASAAMPRILPIRPSMHQGQFAPSKRGGGVGKPNVYTENAITHWRSVIYGDHRMPADPWHRVPPRISGRNWTGASSRG